MGAGSGGGGGGGGEEGGGRIVRGPKVNPKLWVMHLITTLSFSFAIWQHCILAIHWRIPTVKDFLILCHIIICTVLHMCTVNVHC
jgi:hypothetical protein